MLLVTIIIRVKQVSRVIVVIVPMVVRMTKISVGSQMAHRWCVRKIRIARLFHHRQLHLVVPFDVLIIILLQILRRVRLAKNVSEEDVVIREVGHIDMLLFLLQKMELIQLRAVLS